MPRQGAAAGRYRMSDQGQPTQRGLQGMYVLRDNAGCQVYRPTWQGTRTVFRPFPGRDPDNPEQWDPFRLSDEDRDWGDWIRRYDMAFSFGVPGITFILKDPRDRTLDDQQNPVWMLHRAINQAVKSGQGHQSWNPLIFGAAGRSAPISPPKDGYVMQGILMEHKSKPQNPPRGCMLEHQPVVLLMSQSAGQALLDKLSEKTADGGWRWPDIVTLDGGMFVQFHQAGTQHNQQPGTARQMGQNASVGGGGPADNNRYEVELLEVYNGISPTYDGIHAVAAAHTKPWDEIIRIPTIEEQVRMLCGAGIPASAIVYALGDVYGDYIPQHVWDQARAQNTPNSTPFQGAASQAGGSPMGGSPMGGNPMAQQQQGAPQQDMSQQPPQAPPVAPPAPSAETPMNPQPPAENPAPQPVPPQPTDSSPMGGSPMGGSPTGQQPVAQQPAQPQTPAAQGFDAPPTADPNRANATMDAIERARRRAAASQQG